MTLPIPVAHTLLPLATPPSPAGPPPSPTEAVAFRDALAVALGEPAAPRGRPRTSGSGELGRPTDARRRTETQSDTVASTLTAAGTDGILGRAGAEMDDEVTTDGPGGPAPGVSSTESEAAETGVVAGRRTHRSEGATSPEAERDAAAPAIVITPVAVPTLPAITPSASPLVARNDSRDVLVPEFRGRLERVITRMEQEFGYTVEVIETGRSQERQEALYAQGRTTPGPVVTWTRSSRHTHGLAADVAIDGGWTDRAAFERLAIVAREEGLRTLGARDPGHIELPVSPSVRVTAPAAPAMAAPRPQPLAAAAPTDDPVGRLFERSQPGQAEGRMTIQPVDGGEVNILPVRTRPASEPEGTMRILPVGADEGSVLPGRTPQSREHDGRMQILPVDSGEVAILPSRTPRSRERDGGMQILPVDAGEVSLLPAPSLRPREPEGFMQALSVDSGEVAKRPAWPPRGAAPDGMMHALPATSREDQAWPFARSRPSGEGLISTRPDAGTVPALPGVPGASQRGQDNIELRGPAGTPDGRPPAPVVAQVATVATVASVATTAQVAVVAAPGAVPREGSRAARTGSRPEREASEALRPVGRTGRESGVPAPSPRDVIASAEQAAAARLWSPPSTGETSRPEQDARSRTEPSEEMFADLLPSFTPDGDAWSALAPEREGLLRPDRAEGPQAIERTDAAERIARALRLQDETGERPVSSVLLRLDHPEGGEDRIRVDLRGRSVGATLDVSDAHAADHLRAHTRELHQALERAGLDGERVVVRTAGESGQALASAAGAERDSVRAASTPSGSHGMGGSPRDPRSSRDPNHSQRDHDQPASRQRRDQGDRR